MLNPKTREMLGLYSLKQIFLLAKNRDFEVSVIEVEKYKQMSAEEQLTMLYNVTRFRESGSE